MTKTAFIEMLVFIIVALPLKPLLADQPTTKPTTNPADVARAKAVIDKAMKRYRSLKSYQDTFEFRYRMIAKDEDGKDVGEKEEKTGTLAFERPNLIAIVTERDDVYCDGEHLWIYRKGLEQYIEKTVPPSKSKSKSKK